MTETKQLTPISNLKNLIRDIISYVMPKTGGTFKGNIDFDNENKDDDKKITISVPTPYKNEHAVNKQYIDDKINTVDYMVYRGELGANQTIEELPTQNTKVLPVKPGDTYKAIENNYSAAHDISYRIGDLLIAKVSEQGNVTWKHIPCGDEPVTRIKYGVTSNITTDYQTGDIVLSNIVNKQCITSNTVNDWNTSSDEQIPSSKVITNWANTNFTYTATGILEKNNLNFIHKDSILYNAHSDNIHGPHNTNGQPTNQTPGFGESADILNVTIDQYGHLIRTATPTITIPNTIGGSGADNENKLGLVKNGGHVTIDSEGHMNLTAITEAEIENMWNS